jgi:hypothetical protein
MGLAPAPQLAACLEVLYRAAINSRILGYEGHDRGLTPQQSDQLAALMDAVHNIPHLVADWDRCDESLLRGMLRDYDDRWSSALLDTYDRTVVEHAKQ